VLLNLADVLERLLHQVLVHPATLLLRLQHPDPGQQFFNLGVLDFLL
jgi:hypothetical protein